MWIQNISLRSVKQGQHLEAGDRAMLIQIVDPSMLFPKPLHLFSEIHQFEFLDADARDGTSIDLCMTNSQAQAIVSLLIRALHEQRNVVVHCVAGVCRSGAIADIGIAMGFEDTNTHRIPNIWVKAQLMRQLGWAYDSPSKPSLK